MLTVFLGFASVTLEAKDIKDSWQSPDGAVTIVRMNSPCTDGKVLDIINRVVRPEFRDSFKAGASIYEGAPFALCWAEVFGQVYIIFSDGGKGELPAAVFEAPQGI